VKIDVSFTFGFSLLLVSVYFWFQFTFGFSLGIVVEIKFLLLWERCFFALNITHVGFNFWEEAVLLWRYNISITRAKH
jgi:hypothetical protein